MKKVFLICITVILCFSSVMVSATDVNSVKMYAPDGRTENVSVADVDAWKAVGWYDYPAVAVYALDGRCEIVPQENLSAWMNVGWYPYWSEIKMYAPDGRVAHVKVVDVAAWKNVGWFTEPCTAGYMEAYANEITYLINTYGRYQKAVHGGINGLKYGRLVDFEKDNVPELVLVYDWLRVCVYRYDNGKVSRIYDTSIGSRFGQTDVSYTFGINETASEPCLVTFQSKDEWYEKCFHVFTVKDGKPSVEVLFGRSTRGLDEGVNFTYFEIDGKPVKKSAFDAAYNKAINGLYEIDACWNSKYEQSANYNFTYKLINATEEELNAFLKQFSL